jgi:hypothetical protein
VITALLFYVAIFALGAGSMFVALVAYALLKKHPTRSPVQKIRMSESIVKTTTRSK